MSMTIEEREDYIKKLINAKELYVKFWQNCLPIARKFDEKVINKRFTTTIVDELHKKEIFPKVKYMSDRQFWLNTEIYTDGIRMECHILTLNRDMEETNLLIKGLPATSSGNIRMDYQKFKEAVSDYKKKTQEEIEVLKTYDIEYLETAINEFKNIIKLFDCYNKKYPHLVKEITGTYGYIPLSGGNSKFSNDDIDIQSW